MITLKFSGRWIIPGVLHHVFLPYFWLCRRKWTPDRRCLLSLAAWPITLTWHKEQRSMRRQRTSRRGRRSPPRWGLRLARPDTGPPVEARRNVQLSRSAQELWTLCLGQAPEGQAVQCGAGRWAFQGEGVARHKESVHTHENMEHYKLAFWLFRSKAILRSFLSTPFTNYYERFMPNSEEIPSSHYPIFFLKKKLLPLKNRNL